MSGGGQIFGATVMHSAANKLADFAGRVRVNSAMEIKRPVAKAAAAPLFERMTFRYGLALGSVAAATVLGVLADR